MTETDRLHVYKRIVDCLHEQWSAGASASASTPNFALVQERAEEIMSLLNLLNRSQNG